jgi:spermidine synthase
MRRSSGRAYLLVLYFLTGFCALIYEISWVRQATLAFGVSIYAYSVVLAAYMGGMALGSYLIGIWADQHKRPLALFAWLQFGLAILGLLTPFLLDGMASFYATLARSLEAGLAVLTAIRVALALLALTPPSLFIGATLPLMSRIFARQRGLVGRDIGWLYAVNTLGSMLGCLLTATFFLRILGLRETVLLASLICLVVAALAGSIKRIDVSAGKSAGGLQRVERPQILTERRLKFVLWAYAASGFTVLAYEVVWARLVTLYTVGAVYSFSIMLTILLAGLAIGGAIGTWFVGRWRASVAHFGFLELLIGLLAVVALFAFGRLSSLRLEDIFQEYSVSAEMAFEGLLSVLTLFPTAIIIGLAFPVASSLFTSEQSQEVGLRVSHLSASNTTGSIFGSLAGGFLLIPLLGLRFTALLLAGVNILIGVVAVWLASQRDRRIWAVSAGVIVVTAALGLLLPQARYLGYWQDKANQLLFYEEGIESTVAVFEAGQDNPKFSTVNGRVEVPTDVLSMRAFYLLGHLPPILKPDARNALMLSFGNGIASGALATHRVPSLEVVELAPEMVDAAREVYGQENRGVTSYPGLVIHVEDARNFLLQTDLQFDLITTDATHPANSSSWALFTREFYEQVRAHLAPGGVFLQWVPVHSLAIDDYKAILRTYQSVFPTATLWYTGGTHTLVLATPEPLSFATLQERLASVADMPDVIADLGRLGQISRHWIMTPEALRAFIGDGEIVTDNTAYFLPINAETSELIRIIQTAAIEGLK